MAQASPTAPDTFACPPVMLITPWYGRNGVGLVVEGIAQSVRKLGGTCVVLQVTGDGWVPRLRRGTEGELVVSICVRTVTADSTAARRLAAKLRRVVANSVLRYLVRRLGIEVAHFHYDMAQYSLLHRMCRQAGLQCVATFHGSDLVVNMADNGTREATAIRLEDSQVITTVSHALQKILVDLFPDIASRSRTVHNAIPRDFMGSRSTPPAADRDIDVLFVGDLIPRKGVDVLVRAVKQVREIIPSLGVVITGDGSQRQSLTELAEQLGLLNVVNFVGRKNRLEVLSLYRRARVLAVPSRAEPFGLVVVEGQASGAVVVASAVGGIPEIIVDQQTGFMVEPDDAEALCAAIVRVLSDEPRRMAVAVAAREYVMEAFSPTRMALNYRDVYSTATASISQIGTRRDY